MPVAADASRAMAAEPAPASTADGPARRRGLKPSLHARHRPDFEWRAEPKSYRVYFVEKTREDIDQPLLTAGCDDAAGAGRSGGPLMQLADGPIQFFKLLAEHSSNYLPNEVSCQTKSE